MCTTATQSHELGAYGLERRLRLTLRLLLLGLDLAKCFEHSCRLLLLVAPLHDRAVAHDQALHSISEVWHRVLGHSKPEVNVFLVNLFIIDVMLLLVCLTVLDGEEREPARICRGVRGKEGLQRLDRVSELRLEQSLDAICVHLARARHARSGSHGSAVFSLRQEKCCASTRFLCKSKCMQVARAGPSSQRRDSLRAPPGSSCDESVSHRIRCARGGQLRNLTTGVANRPPQA